MTLIKKIEPRMYCSTSLVWWDFKKLNGKRWMFILAFYLFFGMLKVQMFNNFKIQFIWTSGS